MRSFMAIARRLRGLFGRPQAVAAGAELPGLDALVSGEEAALTMEALLADAIWRAGAMGTAQQQRAQLQSSGMEPVSNAFGRTLGHTVVDGGAEAVAGAAGVALTGARASVFLTGDRLIESVAQLRTAAERRIPLVVHATCEAGPSACSAAGNGHGPVHTVADLGGVVLFARNAQEVTDLTFVARRVAERALVPAVVAMDGPETATGVQDLKLLDPELVRRYLGSPSDELPCPTGAQSLVFGDVRRTVPRWFDPDRPASLGAALGGNDLAAALTSQRVFFDEHTPAIVRDAMTELGRLTGRPIGATSRQGVEDAQLVIVAQGAAVEVAEAVATHLRVTEGVRVGVLGIVSLRPFPRDEVRAALAKAQVVTVLERMDSAADGGGPLWSEIRAAVPQDGVRVLSATYGLGGMPPAAAELVAVVRNMQSGDPLTAVHLDLEAVGGKSRFPRRQALLDGIQRSYPDLGKRALQRGPAVEVRPPEVRTVSLYAQAGALADEALPALAAVLEDTSGHHLRGYTSLVERGFSVSKVAAAGQPLGGLGADAPVDVVLVASLALPASVRPFDDVKPGGAVVISADLAEGELWAALDPSWREQIKARELRLFAVHSGLDALCAAVQALMAGGEAPAALTEIKERPATPPPAPTGDRVLPLAVRRFEATDGAYDSVSRFWGEVAEPRIQGELSGRSADPYLALRATPASTATFQDRTPVRAEVPVFDALACTGCGACWTGCPDSAIAVTALGTEELLNAAADRVAATRAERDPAADKLKRSHKQLASRVDTLLGKASAGALTADVLNEAFSWLVDKMSVAEADRPAMSQAFAATVEELARLPLSVTDAFFHGPRSQKKEGAEILSLAFAPSACQGCGVCATVCPDDAIRMTAQTGELVSGMRATHAAWEALPDTPGGVIARAMERPEVGPLPAILLSRACLFSLAGGDGAEPGSGERLATRLVLATAEYHAQRRLLGEVALASDLVAKLQDAIRKTVAGALPAERLDSLKEALAGAASTSGASTLLSRLESLGERTQLDQRALKRLVSAARDVEALRALLASGRHGMGRARYGVVAADGTVREWAASYPYNPFSGPATMDLAGNGAEVAQGIVEGLLAQRVDEARIIRRAQLALAAPSDVIVKERALEALSWRDLTPEELSLVPPLFLLIGSEGTSKRALSGLTRLLASELPVKVVYLDGHDLLWRSADPTLVALAHRGAYVLSGSVAHPNALFEGVEGALSHTGPAFVHLYAPSPSRHGFATAETVARAKLAVDCRVHPLLTYDPRKGGVFGQRIDLSANPMPEQPWSSDAEGRQLTPAVWAAGERRYAEVLTESTNGSTSTVSLADGRTLSIKPPLAAGVADAADRWATLQELGGLVSPFVDAIKERVASDLAAAHKAEIAALVAEHERRLAEVEDAQTQVQAGRLRDRLLRIAGYGGTAGVGGKGSSS